MEVWRFMQHHSDECCGVAKRVRERAALSCQSRAAYFSVLAKQTWEQLEAVRGRRLAVLPALASFVLELPEGWEQDPPSRLEMCSHCAKLLEEVGGQLVDWAARGCGFQRGQLGACLPPACIQHLALLPCRSPAGQTVSVPADEPATRLPACLPECSWSMWSSGWQSIKQMWRSHAAWAACCCQRRRRRGRSSRRGQTLPCSSSSSSNRNGDPVMVAAQEPPQPLLVGQLRPEAALSGRELWQRALEESWMLDLALQYVAVHAQMYKCLLT